MANRYQLIDELQSTRENNTCLDAECEYPLTGNDCYGVTYIFPREFWSFRQQYSTARHYAHFDHER